MKYLTWRPTWGSEHTNDKMSEELVGSRAKCSGNPRASTQLANEAHDLLKNEVLNLPQLKILAELLLERLEFVKSLDKAILKMCKVKEIELEIEDRTKLTREHWKHDGGSWRR